MSDGVQGQPHRNAGRRRRRGLRAFRRAAAESVVISVVVAAVPPLRQFALYGATAAVLRAAERWAPTVVVLRPQG